MACVLYLSFLILYAYLGITYAELLPSNHATLRRERNVLKKLNSDLNHVKSVPRLIAENFKGLNALDLCICGAFATMVGDFVVEFRSFQLHIII
jgi:hypothetical protein